MCRTYPDDCPSDGVSSGNRDACQSCTKQGDRTRTLRAKPPEGFQFRDPLAHRTNDPPAPEVCSRRYGAVCRENDWPVQMTPAAEHVLFAHESGGVQRTRDNSHRLLSIVASVPEAIARSREKLSATKPTVYRLRCFPSENPRHSDHKRETQGQSHNWSYDDEQ